MKPEALDRVIFELRRSAKYAFLCESTLRRAAAGALAIERKEGAAVKRAKRKLHQVFGAYIESSRMEEAELMASGLPQELEGERLRETCLRFLACHASSAERVPFLDELYALVRARVPEPKLVLDPACGFHPFGIPWMGLPEGCRYLAFDIDTRITGILNRVFSRMPGGSGFLAEATDAEDVPRSEGADIVFLLKALPGLERQRRGLGRALLETLSARFAVVSFPALSLGGREKGMAVNYDIAWRPVFLDMGYDVEKVDFPTESFYLLAHRRPGPPGG